jgi:hypothetical protein
MDRKTIISLSIIAALMLIIVLRNVQFFNDLPGLSAWEGKANEIVITKKNATIRLYQKDGKWVINDPAYPADNEMVKSLEDSMKNLTLTDLISEKKQYDRYDLSKDKAIHVIVKNEIQVLRDVLLGKTSSIGRKVYIKLAKYPEVYLASGSLVNDFNKSVDEYREKNIFSVSKDALESVTVNYKGHSYTLKKEEVKDEAVSQKDAKEKENTKTASKIKWYLAGQKHMKLDEKAVDSFLESFSSLRAQSFPPDNTKVARISCKVELKAFGRALTLSIGAKNNEKNVYLATSSETDFPFYLNAYFAEKFMQRVHKLKAK